MARGENPEWSEDFFERAARAGSFSLLLFAIVSLVSSILLPLAFASCATSDNRPSEGSGTAIVSPSGIWAASHFLFAALMLSTVFVGNNVRAAQYILAGCGICWAVAMWVPFALIGTEMRRAEFANATNETASAISDEVQITAAANDDFPNGGVHVEVDGTNASILENGMRDGPVPRAFSAGVLLGIHNVYVVVPQFVTSLLAAAIFAIFTPAAPANPPSPSDDWQGDVHMSAGTDVDSVGWVLRIGGLSALVAGVLARTRL